LSFLKKNQKEFGGWVSAIHQFLVQATQRNRLLDQYRVAMEDVLQSEDKPDPRGRALVDDVYWNSRCIWLFGSRRLSKVPRHLLEHRGTIFQWASSES
jgi:hypothetical protein